MTEQKQNLKKGVIVSYLWALVHIGVNFIYAPLLIKFLGNSEYGLYQVVASFLAYITVLETSLSTGVLRFYCNAKMKGSNATSENILAICRGIYRKLGFVVIVLGVVLVYIFRIFYQSSFTSLEIFEGSVMLGLLFLNLWITMLNAVYLACIRGNERFVFEKMVSIIAQIIQLIMSAMILFSIPYAIAVVLIQVFVNIVISIVRYGYVKKKLKVRIILHERDKKLEKSVLIFASSILLANIADQIFLKTDQIILGKLYDTAMVAVYSISTQIWGNYMYAGVMIANVFFPRVSQYYQEGNGLEKISALFIKVGRIAFFLCFMVLSGFIILGKEFLYLWVGEEYLSAYGMAIVVMIPFTIDIIQHLGLTILQVMNKYSFRAKVYMIAALLNIVLTIILGYLFQGFGAALSTGIAWFLTSGVMLNWYYKKVIQLDIVLFWKNIGQIIVRIFPVVIVYYIVNAVVDFSAGIIGFMFKLGMFIVVYVLTAYHYAMNQYERQVVQKLLKKMIVWKK